MGRTDTSAATPKGYESFLSSWMLLIVSRPLGHGDRSDHQGEATPRSAEFGDDDVNGRLAVGARWQDDGQDYFGASPFQFRLARASVAAPDSPDRPA